MIDPKMKNGKKSREVLCEGGRQYQSETVILIRFHANLMSGETCNG